MQTRTFTKSSRGTENKKKHIPRRCVMPVAARCARPKSATFALITAVSEKSTS